MNTKTMQISSRILCFCGAGRRNRRGFSLLEVVLAATIFGIVMLSAYALMVYAIGSIRNAREIQYATRVLESTIEATRYLSWDELIAQSSPMAFNAGTPLTPLYGKGTNSSTAQHADFRSPLQFPQGSTGGEIFIEPVTINSVVQPDMRKVTVALTYLPYGAKGRSTVVSSTTYLTRNGVDRR